jgi:ribulose kinase
MGLRSGIPIAEGGIDAHVGLLGLNALEPTRMGLIVGSSTVMFVLNDSPIYSSRFWGPYPDAILEGTWLVEAGQTSSGSIINWLVQNFQLGFAKDGADKETLIARLEEEAAALPADSSGLLMLDYWQGNRTPRRDPRAKGIIFGLTLAHDYRHLLRSAYEGIVFGTRHIIDSLREEGIEVRTASAGGGGVKSKIWLQLTADVCGIPITVPQSAGACGVVGSAIAAACGSGFYGSLREAASRMVRDDRTIVPSADPEAYVENYGRYRELYEKTRELL